MTLEGTKACHRLLFGETCDNRGASRLLGAAPARPAEQFRNMVVAVAQPRGYGRSFPEKALTGTDWPSIGCRAINADTASFRNTLGGVAPVRYRDSRVTIEYLNYGGILGRYTTELNLEISPIQS